jgi:hypothetical protein
MTIISCILFFDFCLLGLVFVFLVVSSVVFFWFLFVVDFLGYFLLILFNFVSQIHSFYSLVGLLFAMLSFR